MEMVTQIENKYKSKTWKSLKKSNLKGNTEFLICSSQEQALRMNYVKFQIDKTAEPRLCRMCRIENGRVSHIVSECKMLAQNKYKKSHNNVCRCIHCKLCEKYDLEGAP